MYLKLVGANVVSIDANLMAGPRQASGREALVGHSVARFAPDRQVAQYQYIVRVLCNLALGLSSSPKC